LLSEIHGLPVWRSLISRPRRWSAEEGRSDRKYQGVKEVSKMSEEKIAGIMRELVQALAKKDVEKALSYFADDASWRRNEGTFNE
jgi:hypothetical protein